ncbi:MAG: hypothetical protein ACYS0G_03135 [Planctomycetota bacterium]
MGHDARRVWLGASLTFTAVAGLAFPATADVIEVSLGAPTLDRWFYPFNGNPGDQWFASVFAPLTEQGFDPFFDNRDGQMLIGFDTSGPVQPGLGPDAYTITRAVVSATVRTDGTFQYDPTADPYTSWLQPDDPDFQADADPGRPVELFGTDFRYGWSATTFPENGPFCDGCNCFPPSSCKNQRSAYPIDFEVGCQPRDVTNNVDEMFDPVPFAIGMSGDLTPGDPVPLDTELVFEINVADPCVQAYLQEALDAGMLDVLIASIFPSNQQQQGTFPKFYTKEDPLVEFGVVSAARLELSVDVNIGPPGDLDGDGRVGINDLLLLLASWGPCPAPPDPCPGDLDGDGFVGINDLLTLLANWG